MGSHGSVPPRAVGPAPGLTSAALATARDNDREEKRWFSGILLKATQARRPTQLPVDPIRPPAVVLAHESPWGRFPRPLAYAVDRGAPGGRP